MLEGMWNEGNTHPLLVGMQTCAATLEINMAASQKIGNQSNPRPRNNTVGHIPQVCRFIPHGHLLNYAHSSTICNSQNLKTTYVLINQRMNKENVIRLHNGVFTQR